eukprot:7305628-Pyramimonas_sp.AAC.1
MNATAAKLLAGKITEQQLKDKRTSFLASLGVDLTKKGGVFKKPAAQEPVEADDVSGPPAKRARRDDRARASGSAADGGDGGGSDDDEGGDEDDHGEDGRDGGAEGAESSDKQEDEE